MGVLHLISSLEPDHFQRLSAQAPALVRDAGPGLESEFMWFNQGASAPISEHKKEWFRSRTFRRAVSECINRDDLVRVVYMGHATPGVGPFSPANRFWFNARLKPHPYNPDAALRALQAEGFRRDGEQLRDRKGNAVEFSLITNSGNRARERMASMIQQDLQRIGIRLNIVTLDFASLIERFARNYDYEACLLGLINVDLDPNGLMNVLLSSGPQHQWNPGQKTPATAWEAEIDTLMRQQAAASDPNKRKAAFDRVQEIVWGEAPFIYLVYKNALVGVSRSVRGTAPAVLRPELLWNIEQISLAPDVASR
jgi:peptide/nickel transport system substrate-binding protein